MVHSGGINDSMVKRSIYYNEKSAWGRKHEKFLACKAPSYLVWAILGFSGWFLLSLGHFMPSNKLPKHVPNCSQFSLINSSQRNIFKVEGSSTQNIKLTKPTAHHPTTTKIQSKNWTFKSSTHHMAVLNSFSWYIDFNISFCAQGKIQCKFFR